MNAQVKGFLADDKGGSAAPSSGNVKALQGKIKHYEKMLAQLEKERSELKTRATMAEAQNKALQGHLSQQAQTYQRKIAEMKQLLQSRGVDASRY